MTNNHLINETSPYLLQHAYNPVNWYPWGEEALEKAQKENKLIIISIGYAACHWCHVMEKESFEDQEVADFMNEHFIAIKVDREERPDIDRIYMDAVQLLTGSGGWPLNVIALPDGKPLYGGTYFPKAQWLSVLSQVHQYVLDNGEKAHEQAEALTKAIAQSETLNNRGGEPQFSEQDLLSVYESNIAPGDFDRGGMKGAPKFPLPASLRFLSHYAYIDKESKAGELYFTTLDHMAGGGIYDQIGGGFARYSVDDKWKVPHFEKMLYDNAQLITVYTEAYQKSKNPLYKQVVEETIEFIDRELTSPEGVFYSSLDADSEGVEGKFYTWSAAEIDSILGEDSEDFKKYFNVLDSGNWEPDRNILHVSKGATKPANLLELEIKLLAARNQRIRPSLDNKILTSWNGLMIRALADAHSVFRHSSYLDRAIQAAQFIIANQISTEGKLDRTYQKKLEEVNGFLDDYAFFIDGLIALYEATFNDYWLKQSVKLTNYALEHFSHSDSPLLFYTSDEDPQLIARKKELIDNVIPSSNSQMAINLYRLGHYLFNNKYVDQAENMLFQMKPSLEKGSVHFANWDMLLAWIVEKPYEVALVGDNWQELKEQLDSQYLPSVFYLGGTEEGDLPLLKYKKVEGETFIYVCRDRSCLLPVKSAEDALKQITGEP